MKLELLALGTEAVTPGVMATLADRIAPFMAGLA